MCQDSIPSDFRNSRWRWYDLPAYFLGHRPVRCLICAERYYWTRFKGAHYRILPRLWMHYATFGLMVLIACTVYLGTRPGMAQAVMEEMFPNFVQIGSPFGTPEQPSSEQTF